MLNNIVYYAGVLMWEIFTCGKMPYGRLKNTEVVERVQRGIILERPKACAKEIYDVSGIGGGITILNTIAMITYSTIGYPQLLFMCYCVRSKPELLRRSHPQSFHESV